MQLAATSTEYVRVPVTATKNGAAYDPTTDAVYLAFLTSSTANPTGTDWHPGTWETVGTAHYGCCLVGPANGGVTLAVGTYYVWIRVSDDPEVPVIQAGILTIT